MRRISACRQLLTGTSMSLYLPPIGTAGFDRVAVSGNRRDPWPPPRMSASVSPAMFRRVMCKRPADYPQAIIVPRQVVTPLLHGRDPVVMHPHYAASICTWAYHGVRTQSRSDGAAFEDQRHCLRA